MHFALETQYKRPKPILSEFVRSTLVTQAYAPRFPRSEFEDCREQKKKKKERAIKHGSLWTLAYVAAYVLHEQLYEFGCSSTKKAGQGKKKLYASHYLFFPLFLSNLQNLRYHAY